ncbi:hypothetical protein JCM3765_001410 [Sporobolomyces pararoseus]
MSSATALGYGLTVRATGLITAAEAWPSIEQTFKFFDLLLLRKQNGALRSSARAEGKQDVITKIPVEVWEEIRGWSTRKQLEEAEDKLLRRFFQKCDQSLHCPCWYIGPLSWGILKSGIEGCPNFENASENRELGEFWETFSVGYQELESIHRLAAAFGLAHPLPEFVSFHLEWCDLADLAFIAIPYRDRDTDETNISTLAMTNSLQDQRILIDVSLELPLDADQRFVRFIRTFSLEVVRIDNGLLRAAPPKAKVEQDLSMGITGIRPGAAKSVDEIKPGWKLYSTIYVDPQA